MNELQHLIMPVSNKRIDIIVGRLLWGDNTIQDMETNRIIKGTYTLLASEAAITVLSSIWWRTCNETLVPTIRVLRGMKTPKN